jgi:hypothetical protein
MHHRIIRNETTNRKLVTSGDSYKNLLDLVPLHLTIKVKQKVSS